MKNIVFIISHIGSGSKFLFNSMNENPRIQGTRLGRYWTMEDLQALVSRPHKLRNSAAIYLDEILLNHEFVYTPLFKFCKFIYLIREARSSLNNILQSSLRTSIDCYYRYRLRRICEMAKQTPGAVLLTWEELLSTKKSLKLIEDYLNLKEPLNLQINEEIKDSIDVEIVKKSQERYERYLFILKNLKLLKV